MSRLDLWPEPTSKDCPERRGEETPAVAVDDEGLEDFMAGLGYELEASTKDHRDIVRFHRPDAAHANISLPLARLIQRYTEQRVLDARIEETQRNPEVPTHKQPKDDNEWWDGFNQGERRVFRLWDKYKRYRLRDLQAQRQSLEDRAA